MVSVAKMPLLQFVTLSLLSSNINPFSDVLQGQLTDNSSVAIVTNNAENWQDILIAGRPVLIRKWSNFQPQRLTFDVYLLDLQAAENWSKIYLKHLQRDAKTKYIFVTANVKIVERDAFELGLCDVVVISTGVEPLALRDPCRGAGSFTQQDLIDAKCSFNLSFIDLPPNTIADSTRLMGYEGQLVESVMDHFGFSVNTYLNRHEAGFGTFDPPTLLCGDVFTRTTLLALGGIYPFYERQVYSDLLFGCGTMQVIWSVPSKAGPGRATWYIILVSEFSLVTWSCALVCYLTLTLLTPLFEKQKMGIHARPFFIIGLLLGHTSTELAQKIFTITVIFFGIMFTNYYLAVLSSKLTLPSEIPEITNMKELSDANLDLVSTPFIRRVVQSVGENTYDEAKASLSRKCRAVNQSSHDVLLDIAQNRSMALARHDNFVKYIYNNDPQLADRVHFMEEPVTEFYPIIMMPKHSCLRKTIQGSFRRLCETGIGVKWFKDLTVLRQSSDRNGPSRLDVDHIRGFLLLLTLGWGAGAIAFFLEIVSHTTSRVVTKVTQIIVKPAPRLPPPPPKEPPPKVRKFLH